MRAVVVYESMYGNTHVVASNIADGLRAAYEVTLVPVAEASQDLVAEADLLIVGGPTHMHGLSSSASRRTAAQAAAKHASGPSLDPDACGPGLRDWLKGLGGGHVLAAALTPGLMASPLSPAQPAGASASSCGGTATGSSPPRRASWSASRTRCSTVRHPGPGAGGSRSASSRATSTSWPGPDPASHG